MPFTPLHLGPAVFFGVILRRIVHIPTFILANVILDIEPVIVLLFRINYPLHGFLHTFIGASLLGILIAYLMFRLNKLLKPIYDFLHVHNDYRFKTYLLAGALGCNLHVLLDTPHVAVSGFIWVYIV